MSVLVAALVLAALLCIVLGALVVLVVNENRPPRGRTEEV